MGKHVRKFDLPEIDEDIHDYEQNSNKEIVDKESIIIDEADIQVSLKLNNEQKVTYDMIIKTINTNMQHSL